MTPPLIHPVLLRPWTADDAGQLRTLYLANADLGTQMDGAKVAADSELYVERALGWNPSTACNFAVTHRGVVVGNVGISNFDHRHQIAWLYYWLGKEARGLGLAGKAAATVSAWAFAELDVFRIELGHRTNNPASCHVARTAGFAVEGLERAKLRHGTERFDVETHARLATDPAPGMELLPLEVG